MPVPSAITDLSTTAASNYPAGSDSPTSIDDVLRAHAAFIAQLYGGTVNITLGDASGDTITVNAGAFSCPNGLNFDSNTLVIDATNNRVGVGTASPSHQLDVSGSIRASGTNSANAFGSGEGFMRVRNSSAGYFGLQFDVDALPGAAVVADGDVSGAADLVAATAVSTAAGTLVERLRIKGTGQVRFQPLSADPSGQAGDVYYNSTTNKLRCHNGTSWNDLF